MDEAGFILGLWVLFSGQEALSIVMKLDLIPMDHGSKSSVPTSSSRGNVFEKPKQEREPPSGLVL